MIGNKLYLILDKELVSGWFIGRVVDEENTKIGGHASTSLSWLRNDLKQYIDKDFKGEVIDLLASETPKHLMDKQDD